MGQTCGCADKGDQEQEVRSDPVSLKHTHHRSYFISTLIISPLERTSYKLKGSRGALNLLKRLDFIMILPMVEKRAFFNASIVAYVIFDLDDIYSNSVFVTLL